MKKTVLIAVLASCLLLSACGGGAGGAGGEEAEAQTPASWRTISAEEAMQIMSDTPGFILVDVRTEQEYQEAHIEGAILIPSGDIETLAESMLPDKDATILIYCRSGGRSAGAAATLAGMGYTNIYDFGGIMSWPYGTVSVP